MSTVDQRTATVGAQLTQHAAINDILGINTTQSSAAIKALESIGVCPSVTKQCWEIHHAGNKAKHDW